MWADLLPLLFTLPLLGLSGFFSGSETMLFGLSAADRAEPVSYTHLTLPTTPYV